MASLPHLIIYVDANFSGLHTHLFAATADFAQLQLGGAGGAIPGDWDNKVSSFAILSGVWQFFGGANFTGPMGGPHGPGLYSWVGNFNMTNDSISSVRVVDTTSGCCGT